jgi:hypothetical protein
VGRIRHRVRGRGSRRGAGVRVRAQRGHGDLPVLDGNALGDQRRRVALTGGASGRRGAQGASAAGAGTARVTVERDSPREHAARDARGRDRAAGIARPIIVPRRSAISSISWSRACSIILASSTRSSAWGDAPTPHDASNGRAGPRHWAHLGRTASLGRGLSRASRGRADPAPATSARMCSRSSRRSRWYCGVWKHDRGTMCASRSRSANDWRCADPRQPRA